MTKVSIEDVEQILQQSKLDAAVVNKVVSALEQLAEEAKEDKAPVQKNKFRHGVVISDPENKLAGVELTAVVVKMEESKDMTQAVEKIKAAAKDFNNNSRKGKKNPVKAVFEACGAIASKFFKSQEIKILTKEPVMVIVTDNKI